MQVSVEQNCPSCGAAIVLREDDRFLHCEYCGGHNYRCADNSGRFTFACDVPPEVPTESIFFVPYIRFKGAIYYIQREKINYKLVDTTRAALGDEKNLSFPVSLGLRPQTLTLQSVVGNMPGRFLSQRMKTREVFIHAINVLDIFSEKAAENIYHRAFIGETLSRIYQPYFFKGKYYYDGVQKNKIGLASELAPFLTASSRAQVSWEPSFIATVCPFCGGSLLGESGSVVLNCTNCGKHWQEEKGRFSEVRWSVAQGREKDISNLPFWRIQCKIGGAALASFGDLIRFTNQPVVVSGKNDNVPLVFLVPAFKVNPKAFLQLSSQLTLGQQKLPEDRKGDSVRGHPVTLELSEAVQAIKAILASVTVSRRQKFPLLPTLRVTVSNSSLLYLPFTPQSHDYIQPESRASVQAAALKFGRSL